MKQSFRLLIPMLLLCSSTAHSQYLGILVNDGSTNKHAGIVYWMDSLIEASIEVSDGLGIELELIQDQVVQSSASLLPSPQVNHTQFVLSPLTAVNNELVIFGSLPNCSIQPEKLLSAYQEASGMVEERLIATAMLLESTCPEIDRSAAVLFWTDPVKKENKLVRLDASGEKHSESPSTQLSEALSPYLISHLEQLALKSNLEVDERRKMIKINLPERLLGYQTQLKVLDESGQVIRHQALNRPLTEVVIRKDQWTSPLTFQVLFQNDSVIWKETWISSITE